MTYPAKAALWLIAIWLIAILAILLFSRFGELFIMPFVFDDPRLFACMGIATAIAVGLFIGVVAAKKKG
jgi:hypothetical protein